MVIGQEALTRFDDGAAPPVHFERAARAGLAHELELATLAAAAAAARLLPPGDWVSFNISPTLLLERGPEIDAVLAGIERPVTLEITEREPVPDYDRLQSALDALTEDARLAVDDAGAGYAGLRHILSLAPELIKLDMGLTRGIDGDPPRRALIRAMVGFVSETGARLVAEGIETAGELRELRRLGVEHGQGYLIGRPAAAGPRRSPA